MAWLYTVFSVIYLLVTVGAMVVSIIARSKYPKRATFAIFGFAVLAFGDLISIIYPLLTRPLYGGGPGDTNYDLISGLGLVNSGLQMVIFVAGIGLLVFALFKADDSPQQQPQQQYGANPYAQPQQPGQYPQQQWQQQAPQQQWPPQQGQQQWPPQQPGPYG